MEANELRIGNRINKGIIHWIGYCEGIQSVGVLKNEFSSFTKTIKLSEIEPVLLTTKRLLKFKGIYLIEKCSSRYAYKEGYYDFGGLYLSKDFELCTEDYDNDYMPELGVKLEYIHQLQNLYFELEREELI